MITALIRFVGYTAGMIATDMLVGLWEEYRMRREFVNYSNGNGASVSAHEVSEETAGTVLGTDGIGHDVAPGDYLIETARPDVFEVVPNLDGYERESDSAESVEADAYDPSSHTVADVLAYLDGADDSEVERVLTVERAGKNRVGVTSYER